jgi:hypothetical protein
VAHGFRVDMHEQEVLRTPGVLARIRRALGGDPELGTGKVRAALEAATLVDDFVSCVRDAIARAIPDGHASVVMPEPETTSALERKRERRPDDRDYDPHEVHYPNPMLGVLGMAMLGWAMMPAFAAAVAGDGSNDRGGNDRGDDDRGGAASGSASAEETDVGSFDMEW